MHEHRASALAGLWLLVVCACGSDEPRRSPSPFDAGDPDQEDASPAQEDAGTDAAPSCVDEASCCAENMKYPRYPDADGDGLGARGAERVRACRADTRYADQAQDGDDQCASNKLDLCGVCDGDGSTCSVVDAFAWEAASCVLNSLGTVLCRGRTDLGALASGPDKCGNLPCSLNPTQVEGLTGAKKLSTVPGCSLDAEGRVVCWGRGRVDYKYVEGDTWWSDAKPVAGIVGARFVMLAPDYPNACAVLADGSVRCWGSNRAGNLGDGLAHDDPACASDSAGKCSYTPVTVSGLSDVRGLAAARDMICAWTNAGKLFCWGALAGRGLGREAGTPPVSTPLEITGLGRVDQVVLADYHGCALAAGKVSCFGVNNLAVLAEISPPQSPARGPKEVPGLPPIVQLAMWNEAACARSESGDVYCWGDATHLIPGANAMAQKCKVDADCVPQPVQVAGVKDAVSLSVSYNHACVLTKEKQVLCWGSNFTMGLGVERAPQACANDLGGCSALPLRVF